jgi:OOP family OmpA-OmpF porin
MCGSAELKLSFYLCLMRSSAAVLFFFFLSFLGMSQSPPEKVLRLPNSSHDEQAPVISPDGKTMFLTIARHPNNVGGKRDEGDIWISTLTGSEWSAPVHAGNVLNNAAYSAVAGLSADGKNLFLLSHYSADGRPKSQGISISHLTNSGWSAPENITIPYFLNRSPVLQGQLSSDASTFVFSAESYDTFGAEDIYVTFKNTLGNWSEAKNLGATINTKLQEQSPSLSKDGRFLFFASNGRQGYGSFDIYFSERLDDTWTNWSAPVNMGANVNSGGRELFYCNYPAEGFALFTSNTNSDGYGDIKIFYPPKEILDSLVAKKVIKKADTVLIAREVSKEIPKELPVRKKVGVKVWGKIVSAKDNSPLTATVTYQSDSLQVISARVDGGYEVQLPPIKSYVVKVSAPGYVGTLEHLDLRTMQMTDLEMNFKLQPIEVGAKVNLKSVLFQQSTSNLLPESADELNMVADFMLNNPKVSIELGGHTDNKGLQSHNVKLSKMRVDKVKAYLVNRGIDAKRISGKGYGGSRPIADNNEEDSRKLNRRVEFTIVKN